MTSRVSIHWFTLLYRELLEYRNSLVWTPVLVVVALTSIMLISVLVANRLAGVGDAVMQAVMEQDDISSVDINIHIDDENPDNNRYSYRIEKLEGPDNEADWDFSRDWTFEPKTGPELQQELDAKVESLNPVFHTLHNLMLMILVLVSANYLLGSLYDDRKDRSILFWKSMPVSSADEVLAKFWVALVVAPAIYIAASLVGQLVTMLLAMVTVWRMDMDPFELILGNIDFGNLLLNQIGGWVVTALWVAPIYGWLLLASAGARRSPFMLAVAPVIVLVLLEAMFFGSNRVLSAIASHLPHYVGGGSAVGFDFYGPRWSALNVTSLISGLVFAALTLVGAVALRRHRWEL